MTSEISLTPFMLPESIRRAEFDPPLAPTGSGFTDPADFRRRYPDGRIGSDPRSRARNGADGFTAWRSTGWPTTIETSWPSRSRSQPRTPGLITGCPGLCLPARGRPWLVKLALRSWPNAPLPARK
jgi:hypothetical protein